MSYFHQHFSELSAYNGWANARVWEKIADQDPSSSMYALFCHIQLAEHTWLCRIAEKSSEYPSVFASIPREELVSLMAKNQSAWQDLLEKEQDPARLVSYQNLQGISFKTALSHILTHVFNHSTYHRAQIASQMRHENLTPATTDFIAYARQYLSV